jgi:hypothetical protein
VGIADPDDVRTLALLNSELRRQVVVVLSADHPLFDSERRGLCSDLPPMCGSLPYLKLAQPLPRGYGRFFFHKRAVRLASRLLGMVSPNRRFVTGGHTHRSFRGPQPVPAKCHPPAVWPTSTLTTFGEPRLLARVSLGRKEMRVNARKHVRKEGSRQFKSAPLRQPVCKSCLHFGEREKIRAKCGILSTRSATERAGSRRFQPIRRAFSLCKTETVRFGALNALWAAVARPSPLRETGSLILIDSTSLGQRG